jgi:hypothetical protein
VATNHLHVISHVTNGLCAFVTNHIQTEACDSASHVGVGHAYEATFVLPRSTTLAAHPATHNHPCEWDMRMRSHSLCHAQPPLQRILQRTTNHPHICSSRVTYARSHACPMDRWTRWVLRPRGVASDEHCRVNSVRCQRVAVRGREGSCRSQGMCDPPCQSINPYV